MSKLKLFCFPYAGGSSAIYAKWKKHFNDSIELCPVELAGRGKRYNDKFYDDINEVVEDVFKLIKEDIEKGEYSLYGHSYGSLISYELAHKINELQLRKPKHIFYSGNGSPHLKESKMYHTLPDEEFLKKIIELGGTPEELIKEKELLELFLPLLRADFKVNETYQYKERESKLDCDFTVINGKEDQLTLNQITGWSSHTTGKCRFYMMDGGHFFINEKMEDVITIIKHTLDSGQ
ncbi:thioesterase II family protein [Alkaliphilus transvaalensis]|uniref:thioesterase II family protein n=1 Tax=Alkaliphilus transvaalensis TaxID=114628 RepID=UPI000B009330|nr:thioesterase domain-containing protein [Alkaliphilus transvaalensis]